MFKDLLAQLGESAVTLVIPLFKNLGKEKLKELLLKLKAKDEKRFKEVLVLIYMVVDGEVEELAKETKTKIDDAFVGALKQAVEEIAAEENVPLYDVDAD